MKYVVLLTCLIGYVWSETCTSSHSECRHTTCDSTSELHCIDGLCTCTTAHNMRCSSLQECQSLTNWDCPQNRRHCIDNMCRCARF
ncbi:serine protease inhibitor Cvsi-2-like [Crassostrea virginica]|uniref:Serine protease inhibitor Cvsi-2-like n=1 Tax=Crassostrea virginica TaxID=6565 RepID=A0A8B8CF56_CRAVI|nr:serine protease inhibitor Cvsi-2-like [Crassostrea virginica]